MNITLLVILRLLILMKWLFQSIGIIFAMVSLFYSYEMKEEFLYWLLFFIIPELVVGGILWIARGVLRISRAKNHDNESTNVPVFGKSALVFSFYFYMAVLSSIALGVGGFLEIPVLSFGIALLACFTCRRRLKSLLDKCLNVN